MNNSKYFKMSSIIIGGLLFSLFLFYMAGCGSDSTSPTNNQHTADPNVVTADSLYVQEYSGVTSLSGVDLYGLKVEADNSPTNDMVMRDETPGSYHFQSALGFGGYNTVFNLLDTGMVSKTQFDTLSKMWGHPDSLTSADFTTTDTKPYGLISQSTHGYIFGFYLKGKFTNGVTTSPIYGMIYTRQYLSGVQGSGVVISVKYNKAGKNKFY